VRQDIRYRKFVGQMLDLRKSYANGLMVVSHPEEKGAHDDFCDSGMLACWGASRPAKSNTFDFLAENPFFR
jgi:hypothetical protein